VSREELSKAEHRALLAAFVDTWSEKGGLPRRLLEARLPPATGFHPATVRAGLADAWDHFRGAALWECIDRELTALPGRRFSGYRDTAVVLAGALPMPTWLAMLSPLLFRGRVRAKPARHDPVSAPAFREALIGTSPRHAQWVSVCELPDHEEGAWDAFLDAECVVAFGSDATVAELARRIPEGRRFVEHGHRASFAVIGPELRGDARGAIARALARDIALWDQLGCLSPVAVYVDRRVIDPFADALCEAFPRIEEELPRGECGIGARVAIADAVADAEFRAAAGGSVRVETGEDAAWVVVREADCDARAHPLHRFVRLYPATDLGGVVRSLAPWRGRLAGLGLAGFGAGTSDAAAALASVAPSRICRVGRMQAPPLAWSHDNRGLLDPLGGWTDLELASLE
jgi:hypothetical protein